MIFSKTFSGFRGISFGFDPWVIFGITFLLVMGTTILLSTAPQVFPEQWFYLFLSIFVFLFVSFLGIDFLKPFARLFYWSSLTILTLPFVFGTLTRGVVRWVQVGPAAFQPSELIKPLLVLFFAHYLTAGGKQKVFKSFFYLLAPVFLILLQPNLGTSLVIFIGWVGCLFSSKASLKKFFVLVVFGFLFLPIIWGKLPFYQKSRIFTFLNPENDPLGTGYNALQATIAVGSGGFTGRGLGQGTQTQLAFLPERHTDFVFASVAEEFGFLGTSLLLLGFLIIFYRIFVIFSYQKDNFVHTSLGGIIFMLFFQFLVHTGMNMGLFPISGIPLPLVSYGGSSLLSTMFTLGIVMSVYRRSFLRPAIN